MKQNSTMSLSGATRTTIHVTGQELQPACTHLDAMGEPSHCSECDQVHGRRLIRYLSVTGLPQRAGTERPPIGASNSRFYPPAVPVLTAHEGGPGILAGRWALSVA